ncbi:monovalent cation:proton antiporter-2 (CPA2) family protein [Achromobacter ruhlandii]|uniref:monovalent cation:proton antiporter-2 (CPA2) family protein n=1 Tax=Achromobacter ruhlandii TaxID=72557 RepID=UPI0021F0BC17|nr:monovalent cation:proton antiporter-2 (CPA2) family protein [Achromobacter ruhlandii]MCV6799350.1 monovalent cation:proton antiporter-2 (CPA2) family protein [Achromobacter ruhlandii]MCV6802367.1 monovalent cation:proton antiporter-2 (CPA2) family protein [Achromobacter ruhlandii]MCV6811824.1 monovalent cation:proton antiporter-2 (CPA2) family protein [Achromobacter ruhlandii]MCV6822020.1 monovalent cation:proton antiporter-2 (CPA2) family protein [Achromobacter ruhlandii]
MSLPAEGNQLVNVVVLLGAAVIAVPLFKRLGLGSVLGYLAAGLAIGPFGIGWFSDPRSILHVAELGVVMFLFIIGLEMQPSRLWKLRGEIFGLGVAQVVACGALLTAVGLAAGLSGPAAFMAAMGFVLSSTAIVMQILAERDETASAQGQRIVSILLLEDLAIVPLLALVALLAPAGTGEHGDPWLQAGIAIGCVLTLLAAGRWLLNPLFRLLAAAHAREVMTAAALLVVLGAALLMELGGLSMAMGAFLAGVLLSESTFRHQLEAEIEPFRGILLGLFFLGVGMSLDLAAVAREWQLILAGVVVFMLVKSIGVYLVARLLRASHAEALTRAALLAQGGEFAFVLYGAAAAAGIFDAHLAAVLIAVVIISMAFTPLCVLALRWLLPKPVPSMEGVDVAQDLEGCALIVGFGRFGQIVTQAMLARDMKVSILDTDTDAIRAAAKWGVKVYYGDGTRIDMLRTAGAETAKAILICIDNPQSVDHMVKLIKAEFPLVQLVVRAYDRIHSLALAKEGVDYQVRETFESALVFGEAALRAVGVPPDEAAEVVADVRRRDSDRFDLEVAGGLFAGRSLLYGNMTGPADGRNDQPDRETVAPAGHADPGAPA